MISLQTSPRRELGQMSPDTAPVGAVSGSESIHLVRLQAGETFRRKSRVSGNEGFTSAGGTSIGPGV